MDGDELGEVGEHRVAVLQRARTAVGVDGEEVVGRQAAVRVPARRDVGAVAAEDRERLGAGGQVARERVGASDVRDQRPARALVAMEDERDVRGERTVGAEHEQTEASGVDHVVHDRQLAGGVIGLDVHPHALSRPGDARALTGATLGNAPGAPPSPTSAPPEASS